MAAIVQVIAGDAVDYLINLVNDPKVLCCFVSTAYSAIHVRRARRHPWAVRCVQAARFDVIICDFPDAIPECPLPLCRFPIASFQ